MDPHPNACTSDAGCQYEGCNDVSCTCTDEEDGGCVDGFWTGVGAHFGGLVTCNNGVWDAICYQHYGQDYRQCRHYVEYSSVSGYRELCPAPPSGTNSTSGDKIEQHGGSDPGSGYPSPAATQADWGDAHHAHCVQPYSWDELLHGYKDKNISTSFKMGGLGKLVEEGGYETWLCFKDHFCAVDPTNPWFCFVYHETNQVFTPWGENNQLKLVGPRGCECVQLTVQGQEAHCGGLRQL